MTKAVDFIHRSTQPNVPANVFIMMDTHSDTSTGFLQHAGRECSPVYGLPSDIVKQFLGQDLLGAMNNVANQALQAQPPQESEWYTTSQFSRGGWRGLLLTTCSPTMQVEASFSNIQGLVVQYVQVFCTSVTLICHRLEMYSTSCMALLGPQCSPLKSEAR